MSDIDPLATSPIQGPPAPRASEEPRAEQGAGFDTHTHESAAVRSTNGSSTPAPAHEQLRRLAGPYAVANLWSHLADAGIPPPPLPMHLRPELVVYGEAHWSTFETDPRDLHALRPFLEWLICDWDRRPGFVFSHYGRNSPTNYLLSRHAPVAAARGHLAGPGAAAGASRRFSPGVDDGRPSLARRQRCEREDIGRCAGATACTWTTALRLDRGALRGGNRRAGTDSGAARLIERPSAAFTGRRTHLPPGSVATNVSSTPTAPRRSIGWLPEPQSLS